MKRIETILLIFLILLSALGSLSCSSTGDAGMLYTADILKQDFEQFRKIIEDKTAGLYTDRGRLEEMLEQAEAAVCDNMNEIEFFRLLAPIVAELKCGHSFLSVSEATENFMRTQARLFPLDVRIIGDSLYIISDPYNTGAVPGSEIISINDESAKSVIETIISNMPTDGQDTGRPRYDAERWFASMYYLYIGSSELFSLELTGPSGEGSYKIWIPAVQDAALVTTGMGIVHDTADSPRLMSIEEGYAIAKIPTFAYSDPQEFEKELGAFFKEIKETETRILILDLRGNYGGSPKPTADLFKYLISKPLPFFSEENPFYLARWKRPVTPSPDAFSGRLFVLMDEAGFSMNSFLLSLLKYHGIGILIGAPSSGGVMCSDASVNAVLHNSGLRLRYSTDVFSTAVEGMQKGTGIQPDILVNWKTDDYLEGRDPVLAAALKEVDQETPSSSRFSPSSPLIPEISWLTSITPLYRSPSNRGK